MDKLFKSNKSKKIEKSTTNGKGKTGSGAMSSASSDPRMLDIESMNFGKFAYRNDKDYQEIKKIMEAYNGSLPVSASRAGGQLLLANTKLLLQKCMAYINKYGTGEKELHKVRCKNIENVIYKISMEGNVLNRANANIDRMRNELNENDNGRVILDHLRQASEGKGGKSNYSNVMNMITANIMAQQNTTKYRPSGASGASFHQKQDGDKLNYTHDVGARSNITDEMLTDSLGSTLHEFGHVNISKLYGGNGMFIAAKQKDGQFVNAEEVVSETLQRKQEVSDLIKIGFNSKLSDKERADFEQQRGDFKWAGGNTDKLTSNMVENNDFKYLLDQVRDYGILSEQQRSKYVMNEKCSNLVKMHEAIEAKDKTMNAMGNGIYSDINTNEQGKKVIQWKTQFFNDHEKNANKNAWVVKPNTSSQLNLSDYYQDRTEYMAAITLANLDVPSEKAIINDFQQKLEKVGVSSEEREKYMHDIQMADTYNNTMEKGTFGSMIEYDPVITQALLNYERNNPNDRSSQYYRKLKAMALRAHVRRLEQRLENEEAEVESMANDNHTNLAPSAKGSIVNRAFERRAATIGAWMKEH